MTSSDRQQMRVTDTDGTSLRVGPVPNALPMFDGGPDRADRAKRAQVMTACRGVLFVAIASALSACASLPGDSEVRRSAQRFANQRVELRIVVRLPPALARPLTDRCGERVRAGVVRSRTDPRTGAVVRQRGASRQGAGDRDEEHASACSYDLRALRPVGPVRPSVKHR